MSAQHDMILKNLQQQFPLDEAATDNCCDTQLIVELLFSAEYQNPSNSHLAQSILETLQTRQLSLSSAHFATLRWVEKLYSDLLLNCGFDSVLGAQLLRLTPSIAASALTDSQFFTPHDHPLHNLCNQLCNIFVGWIQGLGRTGQAFVTRIETLVEDIIGELSNTHKNYEAINGLFHEFETNFKARIDKLDKRAIASEMGKLKAKHAKEFVAKALDEQLQSVQLPLSIQQVLQGSWHESLQLVYLRNGSESPQWTSPDSSLAHVQTLPAG